jgi:hypothetical protein
MQQNPWQKALAFSLLLHGVLLVLVMNVVKQASAVAPAEPEHQSLQLSLVARNPQRSMPEPPEALADTAADSEPAGSSADVVPEESLPADAAPAIEEDSVQPAPAAGLADAAEDDSRPDSTGRTFTTSELQGAVTALVRDRRTQFTTAWMSDCLLHQKEHGTKDCPAQTAPADYTGRAELNALAARAFAGITRPQQHARLRAELLASSAGLQPLMDAQGSFGELARQRYFLNREYLNYLSGNTDFNILGFVQASQGLQYDAKFLQSLCSPQPCIYEYTGFQVTRPEPETSDDTPFVLRQTLFGSRR